MEISEYLSRTKQGELLCGFGVLPCGEPATHRVFIPARTPEGNVVEQTMDACETHAALAPERRPMSRVETL